MNILQYLIPYRKIAIETRLKPAEVIHAFQLQVKPESKGFVLERDYTKPYVGEVRENTFEIARNIRYRNSFRPWITGTVEPHWQGSLLRVKMSLYPLVLVFGAVAMSMLFTFGFITIRYSHPEIPIVEYSRIAFPFVFYGIILVAFHWEANISQTDLLRCLDGALVDPKQA